MEMLNRSFMLANQTTRTFVTSIVPRFPWSLNNNRVVNIRVVDPGGIDMDPTSNKNTDPDVMKTPGFGSDLISAYLCKAFD